MEVGVKLDAVCVYHFTNATDSSNFFSHSREDFAPPFVLSMEERRFEHCCANRRKVGYSGINPQPFRATWSMGPSSDHECLAILQAEPRNHAAAEQALATLFERYDRFLRNHLRCVYPMLRDADLGELSQETWLKVWKHLDSRLRPEAFRGWLFRVGKNAAIDELRRKNVRSEESWSERDIAERMPNHVHDLGFAEQLKKCVEKMPDRLREFVRRLLNLETADEIAATTEQKKSRIYQLKHEAGKLLMQCMEQNV